MIKLCEVLEVDPSEVTLAILSYYVRSPSMGVFQREDYINGWVALGDVDSVEKQKKMMVKVREDLLNDAAVRGKRAEGEKVAGSGGTFNRVYDFVYNWGRQEGQKQLGESSAVVVRAVREGRGETRVLSVCEEVEAVSNTELGLRYCDF